VSRLVEFKSRRSLTEWMHQEFETFVQLLDCVDLQIFAMHVIPGLLGQNNKSSSNHFFHRFLPNPGPGRLPWHSGRGDIAWADVCFCSFIVLGGQFRDHIHILKPRRFFSTPEQWRYKCLALNNTETNSTLQTRFWRNLGFETQDWSHWIRLDIPCIRA